jgi:hypothetical protein
MADVKVLSFGEDLGEATGKYPEGNFFVIKSEFNLHITIFH